MRHACPASWRNRTIWAEFYAGFEAFEGKNVIGITGFICKIIVAIRKSRDHLQGHLTLPTPKTPCDIVALISGTWDNEQNPIIYVPSSNLIFLRGIADCDRSRP